MSAPPPPALSTLAGRYDPEVFELGRRSARLRLVGAGDEPHDVVLDGRRATLGPPARGERPDAVLTADAETWAAIVDDLRGGMDAFRAGRLSVRHDLHLGIGFL